MSETREMLKSARAGEMIALNRERGYQSPDPSQIQVGERAGIRIPDAQAKSLENWLAEAKRNRAAGGEGGAIVVQDINGTRYGFHHADDPAPQNTDYNIACFNENTSRAEKFRVQPGLDNPVDPNTTIWVRKLTPE